MVKGGLRRRAAACARALHSVHLAHLVGVVVFVLFVAAPFAPKQADATSSGPVPELSTRTSLTDRNGDGSLTTHLYAGSVNYRAGGSWQPN